MTISLSFILSFCTLLTIAPQVWAQSNGPKSPSASNLRVKFINAFGKDFDLVKDEIQTRAVERGGGTYWLAYVKPKRTGYFYLQYRYLESWPLDIREHEIRFSVGAEKCRRGTPESGVYSRFCLGDTLIVPVLVNNYRGHEFKLTKAEYTNETSNVLPATSSSRVHDPAPVNNPAEPVLRYLGRSSRKMYHRIPGYTLGLSATFVAVSPGRLNLVVRTTETNEDYAGLPVIVLPLGTPATLIAGREEVRGYRRLRDGTEFLASTSGNSYMTNVLILQPEDEIAVTYFSAVRRPEFAGDRFDESRRDPSEDLKPMIRVRPFKSDVKYDFTEWIVDHLP